jgi:hypothetical protein
MREPEFALSIQQPWAWLIVNGLKDIENRSWPTRFRGPVLIHAGKKVDTYAAEDVEEGHHPVTGSPHLWATPLTWERGGIVGVAEIVDCVTAHSSEWFVGEHGFILRNARPLPFRPCSGKLGFFRPEYRDAG